MYLYETHMHTCQGSACGVSTGAEHARAYKARGYQGIIITDHFLRGNSAVDRSLPWEQIVRWFASGYEDAKAEGDRIGLDVFFGWEENYDFDEYLIYGLSPEWLLAHPEVRTWTRKEQLEQVHKYGGCVVQAHPFRERDYMDKIVIGDLFADAAEVGNGGNYPICDACAHRYATEEGILMTAGSDNHLSRPDSVLFGVGFEKPLTGADDYARRILAREQPKLIVPDGRFDMNADPRRLKLTPYHLNEKEERTNFARPWFPAAD